MTVITIPNRQLPGLRALVDMTADQVSDVATAMLDTKPSLSMSTYAAEVASKINDENVSNASLVVRTVLVLYAVRSEYELNVPEFVDALSRSSTQSGEVPFTPDQQIILATYLKQLLSLDHSVDVAAKASAVFTAHEHTFCNARLLTDIRPIFRDDPSSKPAALTVVHSLRIGYHEAADYKEFYVALDNSDVEKLHKVLERGLSKESGLKSLFEEVGIGMLEAKKGAKQ